MSSSKNMSEKTEENPLTVAKKSSVDGIYQNSDDVKNQIKINKLINNNYHLWLLLN